jgi:transposase
VPRQYQSTDTDHRGRITKRGPRTLRKLLVECAWCMLRYNAWARSVYQRLTHGGKTRKKQAIVALARKLLVRCWAMLRDGAAWHDPQTRPKQALPPSKQRTEQFPAGWPATYPCAERRGPPGRIAGAAASISRGAAGG